MMFICRLSGAYLATYAIVPYTLSRHARQLQGVTVASARLASMPLITFVADMVLIAPAIVAGKGAHDDILQRV